MATNFLLVGNGAREHAIAKSICKSPDVKLFAYMSAKNPGIAQLCETSKGEYAIGNIENGPEIAKWAKHRKITLAFPSTDAVLAAGVCDELKKAGIRTCAPLKAAARIEWDKNFLRRLMTKYRIGGCPRYKHFDDAKGIDEFVDSLKEVAVKPVGLTGGKGVAVSGFQLKDSEEAKAYAKDILEKKTGGPGGVLIEEKLVGEEFTLMAFCDGKDMSGMRTVQDHKRAFEGDVGPNCYSADTEVLTERGWMTFGELAKEDRVMIFQPEFKRIRLERPKAIYWRKYSGKMINFSHREIDLLVTPNHRMLVRTRKGEGSSYKVVEARNLKGEVFIPQTGRWIGMQKKYLTLAPSNNRYGPKTGRMKIKIEDWAAFLGLYLSEGYAIRSRLDGSRVYICQERSSKHYESMRKILDRLPFRSYEDKKGFRINSAPLYDYLKRFGTAHDKYVPIDIKNAKPRTIEIFLEAFCLGDGDIHRGQMRLCSSSKKLIDDFQELFMKIGRVGIITKDKRKTMINPINKKMYAASPIYSIEVKKRDKTGIRKKDVREVEYKGYIGCVTVSTGLIVVRRNHRVAISGNTGGMGSYSDNNIILPFLTQEDYDQALKTMKKIMEALEQESGEKYVGVMYGQFMATQDGVSLIEVNARFGDPEALNALAVLKTPLLDIFNAMADGTLAGVKLEREAATSVVKYVVPEGYPDKPVDPFPIGIDYSCLKKSGAEIFFASVDEKDGQILSGRSRSIAVLGKGPSIADAQVVAEEGCGCIYGKLWHRKDIGTPDLVQKRIEQMQKIRKKY